jgi:hypothetical protein
MHSSGTFRQQSLFRLSRFSVICFALAVVAVVPAAAESIAVGATRIELSAPAGYVSYRQVGDELETLLQTSVPKNNILIDGYVAKADAESFALGEPAAFDTYFLAQVEKSTLQLELSDTEFAELKRYMRQKLTDGPSNGKEAATNVQITARVWSVSRAPGAHIDEIGSGQMGFVEFLPEMNRAMGYITASRSVDNGVSQVTSITAITLVKIKGRVLLLNTVSSYRGRADLRWLRLHSLAWTKQVIAANP